VPHADLTGQVLDDRYRVIEPIGEGAMGSVYRGERLKLGRMVAIKVLNEAIPNESSRKRFEREAMAMAKLEHPNCGTVLDVGVHDGNPFVVMELVSGTNVKELLKNGPLGVERAVDIVRQVLAGLSHAHEHGIIHRDIKPANIMLTQKSGVGDVAKILDFGLVRTSPDKTNLTGAMVLGTPSYMAPEQIRGGDIDGRVDLYACGVMLFELLTGTKPFVADDPMAVCMQHMSVAAPRLADKAPGKSFGPLEDVVARALAKDPARRFASAEEFSRALVEAARMLTALPSAKPVNSTMPLEPSAILTKNEIPVARTAAKSKRTLAIVGGAIAAVAIGVGVVVSTGSDAKTQPAPKAAVVEEPKVEIPPPAPPPAEDAVGQLIARAQGMGREAAIDTLVKARKTYPKDARLAYEAARLYLGKMWWDDGLKQARAAIELDPKYNSDPELIKLVLKGFNTTASYDSTLARFLRVDIGAAAKPYMEDTAKAHPNPIVRKRAASELKRYP
jgi:serine/threonine-protein kinase